MLAVIKTGGKQYIVKPGDRIRVERLRKENGEEVIFDEVLLVEKNKKLEIGKPFVENVSVRAEVIKQGKGEKIIVFKYKPKKRYKRKIGHRQPFTEVEIKEIKTD